MKSAHELPERICTKLLKREPDGSSYVLGLLFHGAASKLGAADRSMPNPSTSAGQHAPTCGAALCLKLTGACPAADF
jgi:hypothetical protein